MRDADGAKGGRQAMVQYLEPLIAEARAAIRADRGAGKPGRLAGAARDALPI
jgi:hypothetical protein